MALEPLSPAVEMVTRSPEVCSRTSTEMLVAENAETMLPKYVVPSFVRYFGSLRSSGIGA